MLLAAGGAFLDQPQLVAVGALVAAAGAAKAFWPARPDQIVATLRVAAEAGQKARQIGGQPRQQIVVHPGLRRSVLDLFSLSASHSPSSLLNVMESYYARLVPAP